MISREDTSRAPSVTTNLRVYHPLGLTDDPNGLGEALLPDCTVDWSNCKIVIDGVELDTTVEWADDLSSVSFCLPRGTEEVRKRLGRTQSFTVTKGEHDE